MNSRILIVGYGSIGKRHLRIVRSLLPDADIRVASRTARSELSQYANKYYTNITNAMEFTPNIGVVANPAPFHVEAANILAQAGAHLLIEKPLAASSAHVSRLLHECRKRGAVVMVGYNLRFLPSLQSFRQYLENEIVGRVISVRCDAGSYLPDWRPGVDYRHSVSARGELGGGVLLELSHEIDYLRWLFGEIDQVQAFLGKQSDLELDVEDTAHLVLGFSTKQHARRLIGTLNMDFIRHDATRTCTAIGTKGSLRWNGITGVVDIFREGGAGWETLFSQPQDRDDSYVAQWRHFLDCIKGKAKPLVTGEDGLKVLHVIEAARASSATGSMVQIREDS